MDDHQLLSDDRRSKITARDLAYTFFRFKYRLMFVFLAVAAAGVLYVYSLPSYFESTASIYVNLGRTPLTDDSGINIPQGDASNHALNDIISLMQGRSVARDAAEKIGVDRILAPAESKPIFQEAAKYAGLGMAKLQEWGLPLPSGASDASTPEDDNYRLEKATEAIQKSLTLQGQGGVIDVTYRANDPVLARDTLAVILDVYRQHHIETVSRPAVTPEFYKAEVDRVEKELETKSAEYKEFREKHNIIALSNQIQNLLASITALQDNSRTTHGDISAAQSRLASYRDQLKGLRSPASSSNGAAAAVALPPNPVASRLQERIYELEARQAELGARYKPGQGPLGDVEKQLEVTRSQLADVIKDQERASAAAIAAGGSGLPAGAPVDPTRQNLLTLITTEEATLSGLQSQEGNYAGDLAELQSQLGALRVVESQSENLERQRRLLEEGRADAQRNLDRASMKSLMEEQQITEFKVADHASIPLLPAGPQKMRNYGLALAAALFLAMALAFLLQLGNNTYRTSDDLERNLDLPVLVTVTSKEFKSCI